MNAGGSRPAPLPLGTASHALEMFPGETHLAALGAVLAGLREGWPCTVMVGEAGVGKTIVLNAVAARLAEWPTVTVLKLHEPVPPLALQQMIGGALGLADAETLTPDALAGLLAAGSGEGPLVVLLVDAAQELPPATLQYLRLAVELFGVHAKRLQLVLTGRPELLDALHQPSLATSCLAAVTPVVIDRLGPAEMRHYIAYRLAEAGRSIGGRRGRDGLGRGVLGAVIADAQGLPRRADLMLQRGLRRGPDGRVRPITRRSLRAIADTPRAGSGLWRGVAGGAAAGLGVVVVAAGGLAAWNWFDRTHQEHAPSLTRPPALADRGTAPAPGLSAAPPAPVTTTPASATADADIARLLATADAQIAAGHIGTPPDDNVLLSFQQLNALLPAASDAGRRLVEMMDARFAAEAAQAEQAGRLDEAARFRQFAGNAPAPREAAPSEGASSAMTSSKGASSEGAPSHVTLLYNRGDTGAARRADRLAAALRTDATRLHVFPGARHATTLVVRYYGAGDRAGAEWAARRLSALTGGSATVELTRRQPKPPAGWVEALIP